MDREASRPCRDAAQYLEGRVRSAKNTSDVLSDTPMTRSAKGSGDNAFPGAIDSTSDIGRGSNDDHPDSFGHGSFSVGFGDIFGDDDDDLPGSDADGHEFGFRAISQEYDELGVDLSPWAPLLGMLDSTEPEASPDDRPFTPAEGVEGAHALELRAESMLLYAERGAHRTGELDRIEVGVSDDNRDIVTGRDQVEIDGTLEEHTGHGLVHVADDVEMNVGGPLRVHAHLQINRLFMFRHRRIASLHPLRFHPVRSRVGGELEGQMTPKHVRLWPSFRSQCGLPGSATMAPSAMDGTAPPNGHSRTSISNPLSGYASGEDRLLELEGLSERAQSELDAGVVSTSQSDPIADDGYDAEVGAGSLDGGCASAAVERGTEAAHHRGELPVGRLGLGGGASPRGAQ